MKIVYVITGLSTGGAEMMLLKLLQNIDRGHFEPYVISLMSKGQIGNEIEALNIPVTALGMRTGIPNPLKLLKLIWLLYKIRPALVSTWMYHADLLGGVAAKIAGCRHILWSLHNSNLDPQRTKRSTRLVVKVCGALSAYLPTQILSCSKRAGEIHAAAGYCASKIHVIPNGFDLDSFRPDAAARVSVRTELDVSIDTPLVGLMARFDPQKNHLGFLEAAVHINRYLPDVHFLLAGNGVDRTNAALVRAIKTNGLLTRMHLLGRRTDMPRLMAALDVLASSSYGEAFPTVLGEAMACGVPCAVTDVGDSAEIVGETGKVVPPGDMIALACCVVELLNLTIEKRIKAATAARTRVASNYEIRHVVHLYEARYMSLYV